MTDPFYDRVKRVDELKNFERPTVSDAGELGSLIASEAVEKYFYEGLENPKWIPALYAAGLLKDAPQKREAKPGAFQLPVWYGGRFLAQHAEQYPDIVLDTAQSLRSDNPQACLELLRGLSRIEPSKARQAIPAVLKWLGIPFSDHFLYELKEYLLSVMSAGYFRDVVPVVSALLEPLEPSDDLSQERTWGWAEAKPKFSEFWLREVIREVLPEIARQAPRELIDALDANLDRAQCIERMAAGDESNLPPTSMWRSAVEPHIQNASLYPLKDLLVDGIRDSLVTLGDTNPGAAESYLDRYSTGPDALRRRIALYALGVYGERFPQLTERVVEAPSVFEDSEVHHELYCLLERQYGHLRVESQERILRWILEGPQDVDAIEEWAAQRMATEDVAGEIQRYRDSWTLRRIWAIRGHLDGESRARLEALAAGLGEPDHPDFLSWSTGVQTIKHVSALTDKEIEALSPEEVVDRLKQYAPPSPDIEHSRVGLAEALAAAVKAKPAAFVDLANHLADPGVRLLYTYYYLDAVADAIEHGEELNPDPILELCSYVVSLDQDPHERDRDRYEAGLREAQSETASLVEAVFKGGKIELSEVRLERIRELVAALLGNPDPDLSAEQQSGWDPATKSLNCVRGKAMHSLMAYARYKDIEAKRERAEGEHQPQLDPFVRDVLEDKLDKGGDPSLAVHSIYGWYLPLLEYFDHDWVEKNLLRILPASPELDGYWRAAWDAYVSFNSVYKRPFLLLVDQYKRAILLLGEPKAPGRLGTSKGERLAEHLAFAYIHGAIDFGTEDGLVTAFYESTGDDLRGHVAFWLSKSFGELKLASDNPIWLRMWALLTWRLGVASESGSVEGFRDEISSYMRWLEHAPVPFTEMEPILRMAVPFLKEGYHKKLVADYLASHAREFPCQAIEILHRVILLAEEPWFSLYEDDLDAVIEAAAKSSDERAVSEAVAVINILGERGDFRWKKLLPGQGGT